MKIAVLGATGPSGQEVVKEALSRGHEVRAIVRNPDKLSVVDEKLEVVKTDIFNADELATQLSGTEAVVSCLGCPPSFLSWRTITFYTDSIKSIVAAMLKADVKRLVVMSSWYTTYDRNHPFMINWFLKPMFLGQSLHNMGEMEQYLETQCPAIDFTSVRCPQLSNAESSGKLMRMEENQFVQGGSVVTPRRDIAKYMLDLVQSGDWSRKCVAICVSK